MCKTTAENNGTSSSSSPAVLTWALPPWHTWALIVGLLAHFMAMLPSCLASMDQDIAHKETFLHVNFTHLLDIQHVGWIRIGLGTVMMLDTFYAFLYGKWEQDTEYYYPYSRLKVVRNIPFRGCMYPGSSITGGFMTLSSFTMVAWACEGVTFWLLGGISLYLHSHLSALEDEHDLPVWIYRVALIGWEICAPTSLVR